MDAIIKRDHTPTRDNGATKYEDDPLNTVGCNVSAITRVGHIH